MKYKHLSDKLDKLEDEVDLALKQEIEKSTIMSKHITNQKAIKVNVFGYTELINFEGRLTFLDICGYHYFAYSECTIIDLIDILNNIQ